MLSVFAVGDVFPDMPGRAAEVLRPLTPLLSQADIVFGNCEGVYSDRPAPAPTHKHFMTAPTASGRGLGILRDEGIDVVMADGALATKARLLNQPFRKHARVGRPLVVLKSAMTLDGKVATRTGDSQWISGESSRARAHRWRTECDAVAVGIGTARADDPLLTSRIEGAGRQPARVVFDSEARLPLGSALVRTAHEVPLVVVTSRASARAASSNRAADDAASA